MDKSVVISRIRKWIYFGLIYVICFGLVERRETRFHVIHTALDNVIPFCEYFVVPYLLWFLFVGVTILYFSILNPSQKEYDDFYAYFFMGSMIFLIISLVYPNIQNLRPAYVGEGFMAELVNMIYRVDTPTNILPSLHVYNSVVCLVAIMKNENCRSKKLLIVGANVLTVLIILSTVFLKQHSVVDVIMALLCNAVCYYVVYRMQESEAYILWKNRRKNVQEV